jgi:hypothetical protein
VSSQSLSAMWAAHREEPFPGSARGREVQGIDLVLLDSLTAGCIESLTNGGLVDSSKVSLLRDLAQQIGTVLPKLSAHEKQYFERLQAVANVALGARGVIG